MPLHRNERDYVLAVLDSFDKMSLGDPAFMSTFVAIATTLAVLLGRPVNSITLSQLKDIRKEVANMAVVEDN